MLRLTSTFLFVAVPAAGMSITVNAGGEAETASSQLEVEENLENEVALGGMGGWKTGGCDASLHFMRQCRVDHTNPAACMGLANKLHAVAADFGHASWNNDYCFLYFPCTNGPNGVYKGGCPAGTNWYQTYQTKAGDHTFKYHGQSDGKTNAGAFSQRKCAWDASKFKDARRMCVPATPQPPAPWAYPQAMWSKVNDPLTIEFAGTTFKVVHQGEKKTWVAGQLHQDRHDPNQSQFTITWPNNGHSKGWGSSTYTSTKQDPTTLVEKKPNGKVFKWKQS